MFDTCSAAANRNRIVTPLANELITFFINCKPTFISGPRCLLRNPLDCVILDSWIFNNITLADEFFTKLLQDFEVYLSVSNNLCGKLVLSLESSIMFVDSFRATSVAFFIINFSLLILADEFIFTLSH